MTRKKTKRKLSEAELQQRRNAAKKSTGPKTLEGKARSSRNNWKHGLYSKAHNMIKENWSVGAFGKSCKTTCQYHPENPASAVSGACHLVMEGVTSAGGDCLDKTVYLTAFDGLLKTMQTGRAENMHEILAAEAAGVFELLHQLRSSIAADGPVIQQPIINKEGDVVGHKPIINPVIVPYTKMFSELGLNLNEMLSTPKAIVGTEQQEDAQQAMATMLGGALARVGKRKGIIIEGNS